jgi:transposase InsO family protein
VADLAAYNQGILFGRWLDVERFIGTLERECLQWGGVSVDTKDRQDIINQWLHKYHSYRPHQALGYLTPDEYKATLKATEPSSR